MLIGRRSLLRGVGALGVGVFAGGWRSMMAQAAHAAGPAAAGPIQFVEVARAAGLDFVLRNGAMGRKYQVETLPGGLGVIDFDGDGWPDLFCTNGARLPDLVKSGPEYWNRLYRNNRDGTFTDVTAKAGLQGEGLLRWAWPWATITTTAMKICSLPAFTATCFIETTATAHSAM